MAMVSTRGHQRKTPGGTAMCAVRKPRTDGEPIASGSTTSTPADVLSLSEATRAALPRPVPALGEMDYYELRIADFKRRHPDMPFPSYYGGYAERYIFRFSDQLAPRLSPQGRAWVARTRQLLQQAIEDKRRQDPAGFDRLEQDDRAFLAFAFSTHAPAYLEAGIADLPDQDLLEIALTPDPEDVMAPSGLRQIAAVAEGIIARHLSEVPGAGSAPCHN